MDKSNIPIGVSDLLDPIDWMSAGWDGPALRMIEQALFPEINGSASILKAPPEEERIRVVDNIVRLLMSRKSDGIRHIFEDPYAPEGRDLTHRGWKHWRSLDHNELLDGGDWPFGRDGLFAYKRRLLLHREDVERIVRDFELLRRANNDPNAAAALAIAEQADDQRPDAKAEPTDKLEDSLAVGDGKPEAAPFEAKLSKNSLKDKDAFWEFYLSYCQKNDARPNRDDNAAHAVLCGVKLSTRDVKKYRQRRRDYWDLKSPVVGKGYDPEEFKRGLRKAWEDFRRNT